MVEGGEVVFVDLEAELGWEVEEAGWLFSDCHGGGCEGGHMMDVK